MEPVQVIYDPLSTATEEQIQAERDKHLRDVSDEEIVAAIQDKRYTYYVVMVQRLGGLALCSLIEYHYFHPIFGPASNDDFRFMTKKWQDMSYIIWGVPKAYEFKVRDMARKIGMRVADGVPAMLTTADNPQARMGREGLPLIFFPGAFEAEKIRKNFYMIENDKDSIVYKNRRDLEPAIRARENELQDVLLALGPQITPEQVRDFLWFGQRPKDTPQTKQ